MGGRARGVCTTKVPPPLGTPCGGGGMDWWSIDRPSPIMHAAILSRSRMDRCRATSACSGDRSRQHVQPLPGAPLVARILPPPPTTNHLSSTCRAPLCLCSFILIAPIIPSPLRHDLYYSRDAHTTPMFRSRPAARALRTARRSIRSYPQHPSSFLEQCRLHINVHTLAS